MYHSLYKQVFELYYSSFLSYKSVIIPINNFHTIYLNSEKYTGIRIVKSSSLNYFGDYVARYKSIYSTVAFLIPKEYNPCERICYHPNHNKIEFVAFKKVYAYHKSGLLEHQKTLQQKITWHIKKLLYKL